MDYVSSLNVATLTSAKRGQHKPGRFLADIILQIFPKSENITCVHACKLPQPISEAAQIMSNS